ncbi:uncharacterized protein LOC129749921 isoform X1 [Uranotaenia lowii]|uniref:uncharacterized protein LOC129749921 isoform X1 n=1 Tax=Uranotaenia lowii TaxID=190385 RepID=UPI00247855B4|nr:uncharacterized protein LOC129749921 isoform X1 [Uranotaenia lowii]
MLFKLHVCCAVALLALLNWTEALPVKEQEVEDLMYKLQQLKQLNDGSQHQGHNKAGEELNSLSLTPNDMVAKIKRSLNNSDRRTLLYSYYARGLAPMYEKRNFDEIDRFSSFGGKRNYGLIGQYETPSMVKRQFDEIDSFAGVGPSLGSRLGKRFDEIDRFAFRPNQKRPFREVEEFGGGSPNHLKRNGKLADEMSVINEYSQ